MAKNSPNPQLPSFSLEAHIQRIQAIVEEMKKGVTSFDNQLELFKEGMSLIKESNTYLNEVELQIKTWTENKEEE